MVCLVWIDDELMNAAESSPDSLCFRHVESNFAWPVPSNS